MSIIGLSGAIGSGKSHTQLKMALEHTDRKRKSLVLNFPVNLKHLYDYCRLKQQHWNQYMILKGGVSVIANPSHIESLLLPESVVCLDEAGVFLNSREFATTSKALLADLAQSRKDGVDLIWAAQFNEQVDKQLRLLTQYWIHCDSVSGYDKELRRPKLIYKRIYSFNAWDYNEWINNPRARSSHFKTRFTYSFAYEGGFLTPSDRMLFKAFNSFARLDSSVSHSLSTLRRYDFSIQDLARFHFDRPALDSVPPLLGTSESVVVDSCLPSFDRRSAIASILSFHRSKGTKPPYLQPMSDGKIKLMYEQLSK
jgi:Zonular occludens toxin (Zot)